MLIIFADNKFYINYQKAFTYSQNHAILFTVIVIPIILTATKYVPSTYFSDGFFVLRGENNECFN